MENIAAQIEKLYEKAENYSKTGFELLKLNTVDKTSDVISSLSVVLVLSFVVAVFTLFVTLAAGILIGKWLSDYALGFFIISGFYVVLGLVLYTFRKNLIKIPIDNIVVSVLLKQKEIKPDEVSSNT